jgi:hypothetical protein
MVSCRQHIGAQIKQLFGELRRHAKAASRILRINHSEVDVMRGAQMPNVRAHNTPPRTAKNIADEKQFQKISS